MLDPCTECSTQKLEFEVMEASEVGALLAIPDFDPNVTYELDERELRKLAKRFSLALSGNETWGALRGRRWLDDLPYQIHTNRELYMMLEGTKPFASFVGEYPPNPEIEEIPDRLFDPYVTTGKFIKREFIELRPHGRALGLRRVLYSLPSESWRIDAYIVLLQTASKTGWNESLERMEGSLLGYEEWQNDAYFSALKAREKPSK
jgi:hypothetical protein